ncbi:YfiT family bacillithiol transferase [Patiriisocius sp. Uisw_017]|jgi:hypothetical protein|uniref:YfiT family bacillithiol transferase n=1 Tax=Patiriisocius sp. Uisw_017 TaxID=3230968 RepID=UPI0039E991F3
MAKNRPQYPIGKLSLPSEITKTQVKDALGVLKVFPEQLKMLVLSVADKELDAQYREGSWTIRQLIHHIADSHNHCYNRVRWMLTEDNPLIKAYDQDSFAAMEDYTSAPVAWSLKHIEVLHYKLIKILSSINEKQWNLTFIHPETNAEVSVKEMALTYSWHSTHHFMHIKNALIA